MNFALIAVMGSCFLATLVLGWHAWRSDRHCQKLLEFNDELQKRLESQQQLTRKAQERSAQHRSQALSIYLATRRLAAICLNHEATERWVTVTLLQLDDVREQIDPRPKR